MIADIKKFEKEDVVVICTTEYDAIRYLNFLHENGYTWITFAKLTSHTNWNHHKEKTCYYLRAGKFVAYGNCELCSEDIHGYKVVYFSELQFDNDDAEYQRVLENIRFYNGYEIIRSYSSNDGAEIVIGLNPSESSLYAVWDCADKEFYFNDEYFSTFEQAAESLMTRIF